MEKLRYTGRDYRLSLFVIYTFLKKPSISFDAILFPILSHSLEKKARGDFIFRLLLFQTPHGFMLYALFYSPSSFFLSLSLSLFPMPQHENIYIPFCSFRCFHIKNSLRYFHVFVLYFLFSFFSFPFFGSCF